MLATVPERRSDGLAWRNLLSGIGAGEGGVGHGEVGWVGVCLEWHSVKRRERWSGVLILS
jgi:hypothetical protein